MKKNIEKYKKDLIIFLIPFTVFIILLLAYYPGIIPYDGAYQWNQVKSGMINNDHPSCTCYQKYGTIQKL